MNWDFSLNLVKNFLFIESYSIEKQIEEMINGDGTYTDLPKWEEK